MPPTHELEHGPCLQSLTDRRRVHPDEGTQGIALRLAPSAVPVTNTATRAQRPNDLRISCRRKARERCANAGETGGPLVAEAERGVHAKGDEPVRRCGRSLRVGALGELRLHDLSEERVRLKAGELLIADEKRGRRLHAGSAAAL